MTERSNYSPNRRNDEPSGTLNRMRVMLVEAGQSDEVDEDILLQYMGLFNHMLGVDEAGADPISVMFRTSPEVVKSDERGLPVYEEYGLTKYGVVSRCVVQESADNLEQRLFLYVRLHPDDREDFAYGGGYSIELAVMDDELTVNDVEVHEVSRPEIDTRDEVRQLSKAERQIAARMDEYAQIVEDWEADYLAYAEEPVHISTLLDRIAAKAGGRPLGDGHRYIDEQVTVFNLMMNDIDRDAPLMANGKFVVVDEQIGRPNSRDLNGRYEGEYVNDITLTVKAMDLQWTKNGLNGHLYGTDDDGNTRRLTIGDDTGDIYLSY